MLMFSFREREREIEREREGKDDKSKSIIYGHAPLLTLAHDQGTWMAFLLRDISFELAI